MAAYVFASSLPLSQCCFVFVGWDLIFNAGRQVARKKNDEELNRGEVFSSRGLQETLLLVERQQLILFFFSLNMTCN